MSRRDLAVQAADHQVAAAVMLEVPRPRHLGGDVDDGRNHRLATCAFAAVDPLGVVHAVLQVDDDRVGIEERRDLRAPPLGVGGFHAEQHQAARRAPRRPRCWPRPRRARRTSGPRNAGPTSRNASTCGWPADQRDADGPRARACRRNKQPTAPAPSTATRIDSPPFIGQQCSTFATMIRTGHVTQKPGGGDAVHHAGHADRHGVDRPDHSRAAGAGRQLHRLAGRPGASGTAW